MKAHRISDKGPNQLSPKYPNLGRIIPVKLGGIVPSIIAQSINFRFISVRRSEFVRYFLYKINIPMEKKPKKNISKSGDNDPKCQAQG